MGGSLLILLDTHVLIWLALDPGRISSKAIATIDEARQTGSGLAVCDITMLEVAQLTHRGRITFPVGLATFLSEVERRFTVFPITAQISTQAFTLPASYPNDPADRAIGATAVVEGLTLVTADDQIRKSRAVPTVW
jgi:PIN domain nuclease of toxin-antitoxin system